MAGVSQCLVKNRGEIFALKQKVKCIEGDICEVEQTALNKDMEEADL